METTSLDTSYLDPFIETMGREALRQIQLKKLQMMLDPILRTNVFYRPKLHAAGVERAKDLRSLDDLARVPFTTKLELSLDQAEHPRYGTNLTFPLEKYTREDLRREYHTEKSCAPYCTISCSQQIAMVDNWRAPQTLPAFRPEPLIQLEVPVQEEG